MKKVLIPIPTYGFDPTEVAIPWKLLSEGGIQVSFITPNGTKGNADTIVLNAQNLGLWKPVLRARKDAVNAYLEMEQDDSFCNPESYADAREKDFDGLLLPGGHDKGVKEFLESEQLKKLVLDFFLVNKPVAAICHGVVLAARSLNPQTGKSVLYDYKTTALLKKQELLAYKMTKRKLGEYYLTYPKITVQEEVTSALSDQKNFIEGPKPIFRDSKLHLKRGFVVKDRNYLSARWPGDAYRFSLEFLQMLQDE